MKPTAIALLVVSGMSCTDPLPPASGAVLWSVQGSSAGAPAFDESTVYFLTLSHEILALDKDDGSVRWRRGTGAGGGGGDTQGRNVLVVGDAVVAGDADIHAFRRSTGERLWQFRPTVGYLPGLFELATDGTRIFAGAPSGHVYALAGTGQELWRVDLLDTDDEISAYSPVYSNGRVYVCFKRFGNPSTGGIAALDANTGNQVWRRDHEPVAGDPRTGCFDRIAVVGDAVVGSTEIGRIHAYHRTDGSPLWTVGQLDTYSRADWRPLEGGAGTIVAGSNSSWVVGLDAATGEEKWRRSTSIASVYASITVAGGAAYTVNGGLELAALDLLTGAVRWQRGKDGREQYFARPMVDGERVYTGGPTQLFALRR